MNNIIDKNKIKINVDKHASRFVIDLKRPFSQEADRPNNVKAKTVFSRKDFINKIKGYKENNDWLNNLHNFYLNYGQHLTLLSYLEIIIRLTAKIARVIYFLCLGAGWTTVFIVRFLFLLIKNLAGFIFANLKFLKSGIAKFITSLIWLVKKNYISINSFLTRRQKKLAAVYQERVVENVSSWKNKIAQNQLLPVKVQAKEITIADEIEEEEIEEIFTARPSRKFYFNPRAFRPALALALILLVITLPLKIMPYFSLTGLNDIRGRVLGASESALNSLMSAKESAEVLDFSGAGEQFGQAEEDFLEARQQLENINSFLLKLASWAPNKDLKLAGSSKYIISAGETGSRIGENLSLSFANLVNNKEAKISVRLEILAGNLREIENDVILLKTYLDKIDIKVLPEEFKQEFSVLNSNISGLEQGLGNFSSIIDKINIFLGAHKDKRYLLIFQNNAEARATGGFIGSFALLDLSGGEIKNIEAPGGGGYDTEGGLTVEITAPAPLHLVNPLWHFWDANWWPDWPTSAEKLMWFYEKSDGPTVDGVISFTPTVMEDLLHIIGPLNLEEEYGVVINADNFWTVVQEIAETKTENNKPKKIIGDMLALVMEKLGENLDQNNLFSLIKLTENNLNEKQILLYFTDEELEQEIADYNWDGRVKNSSWDYLSIINTNIAGGKSDRRIKQSFSHFSEVLPDGSIIDTLKIERRHEGEKGERFTGVRNVNWLRVYVPEGSELIEASGFREPDKIYFEDPDPSWQQDSLVYRAETTAKIDPKSQTQIYEEFGKTVFANWSMVDPGETTIIYFKYKLPFRLNEVKTETKELPWMDKIMEKLSRLLNPGQKQVYPYALFVQKQAGASVSEFNSNLKLPANFQPVWFYPNNATALKDGWQIKADLNKDMHWAILAEPTKIQN